MNDLFMAADSFETKKAKIKVIGVGGGGGKVSVKAYPSYSDLPLVGKENEIAIIAIASAVFLKRYVLKIN